MITESPYCSFGSSPYTAIVFSEDMSPYELGYFGERKVQFIAGFHSNGIDKVVEESYEEFMEILTWKSNEYIKEYPEDKEKVEKLMLKIKERLDRSEGYVTEDDEKKKEIIKKCFETDKEEKYIDNILPGIADYSAYSGYNADDQIYIICSETYNKDGNENFGAGAYFGERKVRFTLAKVKFRRKYIAEVSFEEFYEILKKYTAEYVVKFPEDNEEVEALMQKIKERLEV